jgi:hypothetical protein
MAVQLAQNLSVLFVSPIFYVSLAMLAAVECYSKTHDRVAKKADTRLIRVVHPTVAKLDHVASYLHRAPSQKRFTSVGQAYVVLKGCKGEVQRETRLDQLVFFWYGRRERRTLVNPGSLFGAIAFETSLLAADADWTSLIFDMLGWIVSGR